MVIAKLKNVDRYGHMSRQQPENINTSPSASGPITVQIPRPKPRSRPEIRFPSTFM